MKDSRQNLIRILQNAYSGELAAAYAYRGHWRSLKKSSDEREKIKLDAIDCELALNEVFDKVSFSDE